MKNKDQNNRKAFSPYEESVHRLGRITGLAAVLIFLAVPSVICLYYNVWPDVGSLFKGLVSVASVYLPIGIIEVFNYSPMLGAGGSYLAFVTGNIANMKVPAAASAMKAVGVEPGTREGELVSTIAVAVSSIVTTLIVLLGVLLLGPLEPIINSPALKPAFDNVLPALFGALGVMLISKRWKVAILPMAIMIVVFLLGLSEGMVGLMVPVASLISIGVARVMYKKNMIE